MGARSILANRYTTSYSPKLVHVHRSYIVCEAQLPVSYAMFESFNHCSFSIPKEICSLLQFHSTTLTAYVHKNDTNCILSQVSFSVPCINTVDALSLQEWQDERLIWDPNEYNGLETLRMPCDKIWLPDIVLYNRYMLFSKSWLACLNNSLHIDLEIQRSNIVAIFQRGWLHFRIYAE